jgi:biopolymer transport protein ExbD
VYYINKEAVPFDQLETVLLQKTAAAQDNVVLLRVPADNKVQDLVDLMQIGVKLKLNFVIATSK